MREALYGRGGFYTRGERPGAHFRTSVHASARYAAVMLALLRHVDDALGHPPRVDLVDVGAGQADLLAGILDLAQRPGAQPAAGPPLAARITAQAVDVAPRPPRLSPRIRWGPALPARITGLVMASEWLDSIPLDIAELTPDGLRIMLVDTATGAERAGPAVSGADLAWLSRWWPLRPPGARAEIGHPRCAAWADVIGRLDRGLAVAADYGHLLTTRPEAGSMAGFRGGRSVPPVPDGSRDLTAHVAIDACAAAGSAAGATQTLLSTQRAVLRAAGLGGRRPPLSLAERDPARYLAALQAAAEEAELTDPAGLGGFSWLVQAVRLPLPTPLRDLLPGAQAALAAGRA